MPAVVTVTNYEQLEKFDPGQFGGVVCDESSCIKAFTGVRRAVVTEFLRTMPYRLLATATAAPNDYVELGTSSEALGYLGYMDMLARFFTNKDKTSKGIGGKWRSSAAEQWRFKGHAEEPFWRWVASWARGDAQAIRPRIRGRRVHPAAAGDPAVTSWKPGTRRRAPCSTCPQSASMRNARRPGAPSPSGARKPPNCSPTPSRGSPGATSTTRVTCWHKLIPGAVQVSPAPTRVEVKEERLAAFARGEIRVLVTKPRIASWGLELSELPPHDVLPDALASSRCTRRCAAAGGSASSSR